MIGHSRPVRLILAGLQIDDDEAAGAVLLRGLLQAVHSAGEERIQLADFSLRVEGDGHAHREGALDAQVLPALRVHVGAVVVAQA